MAKFTSSVSKGAGALLNWFDDRLPVSKFWNATMTGYMAPRISISGITWVRWPCWYW